MAPKEILSLITADLHQTLTICEALLITCTCINWFDPHSSLIGR